MSKKLWWIIREIIKVTNRILSSQSFTEYSHNSNTTTTTTNNNDDETRRFSFYVFLKARARLEMREKASRQDAQDVVEIMKYSLLDTFSDDFGNLDFQRSQHGSGMSSRAQVRRP